MRFRRIVVPRRIGPNDVIVGATTDLDPLLLLMVLTLTLFNLLVLMFVDHPTSTRDFKPTRSRELSNTRMLRRPQVLSRHAHTVMLEMSSRLHLLMAIPDRRRTMLRKSSGPHMSRSMLIADEIVGIRRFLIRRRGEGRRQRRWMLDLLLLLILRRGRRLSREPSVDMRGMDIGIMPNVYGTTNSPP